MTWANCSTYEGEWINDKMIGYGIKKYAANGGEYAGYFKDDEKSGNGTYTWADGSTQVYWRMDT